MMADLSQVIPLTGRRRAARTLLLAVIGCLTVGIIGVAVAGPDSAWAGLLSLVIPGLGQLVQGDTLIGILLLVLFVFILVDLFALFNRVFRLGVLPLAVLAPAAALGAATTGEWWSYLLGAVLGLAAATLAERGELPREAQPTRSGRRGAQRERRAHGTTCVFSDRPRRRTYARPLLRGVPSLLPPFRVRGARRLERVRRPEAR